MVDGGDGSIGLLKEIRGKAKNPILSFLNINSLRNKIDNLFSLLGNLIDVLVIAETKLDSSFTNAFLRRQNFKIPFRLDVNGRSGGILVYIREGIPSRFLKSRLKEGIQIIVFEIRLGTNKWLIISVYKNPTVNIKNFLEYLNEIIDEFLSNYDKIIIVGDFNIEPLHPEMKFFLESWDLVNLITTKTCFKSTHGSCIDLILTNRKYCFMHTGVVETGVSDFHLMPFTMFKSTYEKLSPKVFYYRQLKNFDLNEFNQDIYINMNNFQSNVYNEFENIYTTILDGHAPFKKKVIRGNNKPHCSRELRKAIMKRSRLKNISRKSGKPEDRRAYQKQRNLVVKLNSQHKKSYFRSITPQNSKTSLWKICKPYFSNKGVNGSKPILLENDVIISNDECIATIFNHYFRDITNTLPIRSTTGVTDTSGDPLFDAISKFSSHPSIVKIRSVTSNDNPFNFQKTNISIIKKTILQLDDKKSVGGTIPTNIFKLSVNSYISSLTESFNYCIDNNIFPDRLKIADIRPCFKKGTDTEKSNYRPISILPLVSKVFEKVLYDQLNTFLEPKLNKILCGFRKGHSTQHALLRLVNKWQSCLDKKETVGTVLMDLSKAYDCLNHDLLIAKLHAYGISNNALRLIYNYLKKRKQRVKVGSSFSDFLEIKLGVPQGSILGPLLFNIFINDLILFVRICNICNFADDNSLSACDKRVAKVVDKLQQDLSHMIFWFDSNLLVANPAKFQLMFLGPNIDNNELSLKCNGITINATDTVTLLGITFDSKLNFKNHIENICKTVNRNTNVLLRIRKYLDYTKSVTLYTAYMLSHFKYCPIIWMFCSKTSNSLVNKTHKRALRVVHNNFHLSLEELLVQGNSVSIHIQNIRSLMTEVFKALNGVSPDLVSELFQKKETQYSLRQPNLLRLPTTLHYNHGIYGISFRASLLWNQLPAYFHNLKTLSSFKSKIQKWQGTCCTCKICRW